MLLKRYASDHLLIQETELVKDKLWCLGSWRCEDFVCNHPGPSPGVSTQIPGVHGTDANYTTDIEKNQGLQEATLHGALPAPFVQDTNSEHREIY